MKKAKRLNNIIILFSVLLVLVAIYVIYSKQHSDINVENSGTDTETSESTEQSYSISELDIGTFSKISYSYNGIRYSFELNEEKTLWQWNENKTLILDSTNFAYIAQAFEKLASNVRIENVENENLKNYGLDDPAVTFSLTDSLHGEAEYSVGIKNEFNNLYYVIKNDSPSTVYMLGEEIIALFTVTPEQMLLHDTLPAIEDGKIVSLILEVPEKETVYFNFFLSGKDDSADTKDYWYASSAHGDEQMLSEDLAEVLTNSLYSIAFVDFITYDISEYAALGLDSPYRLTVNYKETHEMTNEGTGYVTNFDLDKSFVLLIGNADSYGMRYAKLEESPYIYTLNSAVFNEIVNFKINEQ